MREDDDADPVQEVRFGVHFVRHKKAHKVGGRLKLDDALAKMAEAQAAAEAAKKAAEEEAAKPNAGRRGRAATTGGDASAEADQEADGRARRRPGGARDQPRRPDGGLVGRAQEGVEQPREKREPVLLPLQRPRRAAGGG